MSVEDAECKFPHFEDFFIYVPIVHCYYLTSLAQFTLSETNGHSCTFCNSYHHFAGVLIKFNGLQFLKIYLHHNRYGRT